MAKVLFIIFGIVVAAFLYFEPEEEPLPGSYHNEPYGFWVKFPDGWETEAELKEVGLWEIAGYIPGEDKYLVYATCIKVVVEELCYKMKSDYFCEKSIEGMKQIFPDASFDSVEDYEVAGRDGKIVTMNYSYGGYPIKGLWFLVTKGKRGYVVGGLTWPSDFEKYKPIFDSTIKSFRLD